MFYHLNCPKLVDVFSFCVLFTHSSSASFILLCLFIHFSLSLSLCLSHSLSLSLSLSHVHAHTHSIFLLLSLSLSTYVSLTLFLPAPLLSINELSLYLSLYSVSRPTEHTPSCQTGCKKVVENALEHDPYFSVNKNKNNEK